MIGPGRLSFLGNLAPILNTDEQGTFHFRSNSGEVQLVAFGLPGDYAKAYPRGFRQTVVIPAGVRSFTLPQLRLRKSKTAGEAN